jgi:hypothetical protein
MNPILITEKKYSDTWRVRDEVLSNYYDYLESDEWKEIKIKLRKLKEYKKCKVCGSNWNIQLHHKTYKYLLTEQKCRGIVPVCGKCHKMIHEYAKKKDVSVLIATEKLIKNPPKNKKKKKKPLYL